MTVRVDDVSRPRALRHAARIGRGAAVMQFVAAAMWEREGVVALADAGQFAGQIGQMTRHEMHHLPFPLNPPADRKQAGGQHGAAVLLEDLRPDDEIGDAALILDRDEHHAFGRSRHLPHQDEAGGFEPAAVARRHRLGAGDDPPACEVSAQERQRMGAERQADMAVVLDNIAAGLHGAQRDGRLVDLRHGPRFARGGGGEEPAAARRAAP